MNQAIDKKSLYDYIDKNVVENGIATFNKGQQVEGKIVEINSKNYIVSVSKGIEALLPRTEVVKTQERHKVGDEIKAFVLQSEDDYCNLVISQKRTDQTQMWDLLENSQKEGSAIEVTVVEANAGGLIVNAEGILGFIPTSQIDPAKVYKEFDAEKANKEDMQKEVQKVLSTFVGKKIKAMIVEANKSKSKLILSEKFVLTEQNAEARQETLKRLKIGDIVEAEVTAVTPYGIFVNSEGLDGLVHLSEISWEKVEDPSVFAKIGDKIQVKLIDVNTEGTRIAYSIKQLANDPWIFIAKDLKIGTHVKGEVTDIEDFGIIVKIESGINGLIHRNELTKSSEQDLHELYKVGQIVDAVIITISPSERKMGLSLKKNADKMAAKNQESDEKDISAAVSENKSQASNSLGNKEENSKNKQNGDERTSQSQKKVRAKSKLDLDLDALINMKK